MGPLLILKKELIAMFRELIEKLFRKNLYEPEYEEKVEHDIVMTTVDGKLVEVTSNDPEVQEQK